MATTTSTPRSDPPKGLAAAGLAPPRAALSSLLPRRRKWLRYGIIAVVVVGATAGLAALAGTDFWSTKRSERVQLTHTVRRGDMLITVTEDGNLESASNVDVKCEVAGGSTILSLVPDGTQVKKGDELARLDSSKIEDLVGEQKIAVEKAEAARIEAKKTFEASKIAVQEYVEGTYIKEMQDLESKIIVALENLRSAENSLQHTQRMARKGYVTSLQREAQVFGVEHAKLDLAAARTAKTVLEKFTRAKTVGDLESKRDTAEAKMRSEQAAFELEDARLKRQMLQLETCIIHAPADGMVVYANEPGGRWGQQSPSVEEGAAVRERQTIIKLPNLAEMQVKTAVHESKIDQLRIGMPARVRLQGKDFNGSITSVANQAESSGWFMGNAKEYATLVKVHGSSPEWKPGITAVVEILVAHLRNVLSVPVQAVVPIGGEHFCWVLERGKPQQRKVTLGYENDTSVEVRSGLGDGDRVVLNPRAFVAELPDDGKNQPLTRKAGEFGPEEKVAGTKPPAKGTGPAADAPAKKRPAFDPMQYDKNGDKKISRDEAPEQMKQFFDMIDTNKDGQIDTGEMAVVRKRMADAARGGAPPSAPGGN